MFLKFSALSQPQKHALYFFVLVCVFHNSGTFDTTLRQPENVRSNDSTFGRPSNKLLGMYVRFEQLLNAQAKSLILILSAKISLGIDVNPLHIENVC